MQLADNGVWEFFYSCYPNEVDFHRYYSTIPVEKENAVVRADFENAGQYEFTNTGTMPIERKVFAQGPERALNVVLVSIEGLGAEWMGSLGGAKGLTPNLERLANEGLYFTKVYAAGTRTVRGLEALTLSVPPTPGHAIPMRPNNSALFTLRGVFRSKCYKPLYLYGGYSYFDMAYVSQFFGRDILRDGIGDPHVCVANNQTIGFLASDLLAELKPRRRARAAHPDNNATVTGKAADMAVEEGIAFLPDRGAALLGQRRALTSGRGRKSTSRPAISRSAGP